MNNSFILLTCLAGMTLLNTQAKGNGTQMQTNTNYPYKTVENDPFNLRIYTLDNGLKVYLSENHTEPRIQTNIAVRTGSKHDPKDATGLAHYLEHMLFKGTSQIGALDWEKEEKLLQQISELYEKHRETTDLNERKRFYQQIDSVSQEASKLVGSNEYPKMIKGLGAQGTNAYTSNERTVYLNDIPSTELEKWLTIESERFSELVLRLFHTELEAVYEEFNRTQDSDRRQAYYELLDLLFPTHPYGQQTTIGKGEHLKTPSMEKIHDYFKRRYVPNNMAIVLAGDFDPDETIKMIDKYFGGFERKEVEVMDMPEETPLTAPLESEVFGSEAEFVMLGFRLGGIKTEDALYAELLSGMLANGTAGLIDLNLNQKQKILRGYGYVSIMEDYSIVYLGGNARQGQDLTEVRDLLLAQLDSIKEGHFEDWMIDAVVKSYRMDIMKQLEYNWIRAYRMSDAFILQQDWEDVVHTYDEMQNITKDQLISWTKENMKKNYAVVLKRIGEKDLHKVDKPEITPISINRDAFSEFYKELEGMESMRLKPQFVDYSEAISRSSTSSNIPIQYVKNEDNDIFHLYYSLDMGKYHDLQLPIALEYLPYLGTKEMSPAEVQKEFFKLGIELNVNTSDRRSYLQLTGLSESFEEAVILLEDLLDNVVPDQPSYDNLVAGILKKRTDSKLDKRTILFKGMRSYAKYGPKNPFNNILTEEQLTSLDPTQLCDQISTLTDYKHKVLYFGPQDLKQVTSVLSNHHHVADQLKAIPEQIPYEELETSVNKVFYCNYDMVQAELMMTHRGEKFNTSILAESDLFNEYFGRGLSSIVFQEIRESKALAYSAYGGFSRPGKYSDHHYVVGYIGTQVDKLGDATDALLELMSTIPKAEAQFEQAKINALKKIETNRTTGRSILLSYQKAQDLNLDYDINSNLYSSISQVSFPKLEAFFNAHIKDRPYTYTVIGKQGDIDLTALERLGPVKELSLEDIFGY